MGIWSRLTGRGAPPRRLEEISQHLARPTGRNLSLEELMADDRDQVEDELFRLCEEDPAVSEVIRRYESAAKGTGHLGGGS